LKDDLVSAREK